MVRTLAVAVVSLGSRGDLFPLLGIGRHLGGRGHRVTVFECDEYASDVAAAGLRFVSLGEGSACQALFERIPDATQAIARLVRRVALPVAAGHAERIVADGRFDAIVAYHFQFAAQLAGDLTGAPVISIAGTDVADLYHPGPGVPDARRVRDERVLGLLDRLGTPTLNRIRNDLGLPARTMASTVGSLSRSGTVVVGPRLLRGDVRGWPPHLRGAGYPWYEPDAADLPAPVAAFVGRADLGPLVVCSLGDSWADAYPRTCLELAGAAERRGFRVLYLTRRGAVTATGRHVLVHPSAPLSRVLASAAAVVHHAGRGSLLLGLRAGVPALMLPHWLDGYENATRAAAAGVGRIAAPDLDAAAVEREITTLLTDPSYRARTRAVAAELAADAEPAEVVEALIEEAVAS